MFCSKCGQRLDDDVVFCTQCGSCVKNIQNEEINKNKTQANPEDKTSVWWAILGFLIPILGLILYLIWKDEYPLRAKSCGKGALVSLIVEVLMGVLSGVLAVIGFSLGLFYL